MVGEHVERFRAQETFKRQQEVQAIAGACLELAAEYSPGNGLLEEYVAETVLDKAVTVAHARLVPAVAHADQAGYATGRAAMSWLAYRGAYLADGEDNREFKPKELRELQAEQAHAEDAIGQGDPFYLKSFAANASSYLHIKGDINPVENPFNLQRAAEPSLLMNILDEIIDSPQALALDDRTHQRSVDIDSSADPRSYEVRRLHLPNATAYVVDFVPSAQDDTPISAEGAVLALYSLTIVETAEGIDAGIIPLVDMGDAAVQQALQRTLDLPQVKPGVPHLNVRASGILSVAKSLRPQPTDSVFAGRATRYSLATSELAATN